MESADGLVRRCDFCQGESVHGTGVFCGVGHREIVLELEVGFDEVAFLACAVNAHNAG